MWSLPELKLRLHQLYISFSQIIDKKVNNNIILYIDKYFYSFYYIYIIFQLIEIVLI